MKIVIIGAGNLATIIGKALYNAGHDIVQVYSKTMEHASQLADKVGGAPITNTDNLNSEADVYMVSIADAALAELIPKICQGKAHKLFIHTAGSVPMDIFKGMALHYGVLYPLQTFSKERSLQLKDVPCFLEANDAFAEARLKQLVESVFENIFFLSSEKRKQLHLAAVFACNFANHCYAIADRIVSEIGVPFSVLLPLINETAAKVNEFSPIDAQTGPAVRFDQNVIRMQAALLKNNPMLKDIYERMSMDIHRFTIENRK